MARGCITKSVAGFRARIETPPINGKRQWANETFRTFKEADRFRIKILSELHTDDYTRFKSLTFDELCDRYLDAAKSRVEATTVRLYERQLRAHVRPHLGHLKVAHISPATIQEVLDKASDTSRSLSRQGQQLGGSSRKNLLVYIRAVFAWGVRMELAKRNPASKVSLPKLTPRDIPDFSHDSIRVITEAIFGTEFETIAVFALMTGSRRGEIAALRWQDVDLQRGRFSIRKSAAILDGTQIYKSPKSLRSRRTEPLPPSVITLLKKQRLEQAKRRDYLGLPLPDRDTVVFDRENGEPWNVNELSRRWSRFIKKHDLPPLRFHDLRHAFASMSHDAGESMHDISIALGHSSIAVTSAIYIHTFDDNKSRRAERLDTHFGLSVRDNSVTIDDRKATKHA